MDGYMERGKGYRFMDRDGTLRRSRPDHLDPLFSVVARTIAQEPYRVQIDVTRQACVRAG